MHCFNLFFGFYEPLSGCFDRQVKEPEQVMECMSLTVEILEEKVIAILDSKLALILSWLNFDSNGFDARSKCVKKLGENNVLLCYEKQLLRTQISSLQTKINGLSAASDEQEQLLEV